MITWAITRTIVGFIVVVSLIGLYLLAQWADEQPWMEAIEYGAAYLLLIIFGIGFCLLVGSLLIDGPGGPHETS